MVWDVFGNVALNIGMSIENVFLLVLNCGVLVFYAKDFKLGIVFSFFLNSVLFVVMFFLYENLGWNYVPALVVSMIFLVILSLTLLPVDKAGRTGGRFI